MANHNLTHHEELRYHYLMRNINYLSPKEQAEYDYLRNKVETYNQYYRSLRQGYSDSGSYDYDEEPASASDWYQQSYGDSYDDYDSGAYGYEEQAYTEQGLPVYDDRHSAYQGRQARQRESAVAGPSDRKQTRVPHGRRPRNKRIWVKRLLVTLGLVCLVVITGMGYRFYRGIAAVNGNNGKYSAAVKEKFNGEDAPDGTNILILGSDKRITQGESDARTDTIMVVNVGNSDNKVKMISFMRDTLVHIDGVSADDYSYDQKLNVAFNLGEQDGNQGAEYMRQTLKDNFGLKIKYYVMLDFETFAEAIDTLFPKGVKIDAKFATVDGQEVSEVEVPDDLNAKDGVTPEQTITVGKQRMDGRTLLNYARFRKDDEGDFGRTKRQQQVMSEVISQTKNVSKLFSGSEAIGKIFALTSTNMPYSFLLKNGVPIMTDAAKGIDQRTMPENGDWIDDIDMYGGAGLSIDFDYYRGELKDMGMR
ncbi:LCP family protein [Streptococcus dentasini]